MPTPLEYLEFWAPQFTDTALQDFAINEAKGHWGQKSLGGLYNEVVGLTAAHLLTLRQLAINKANVSTSLPGTGAISGMSTGGVSVSWSTPDQNAKDAWLRTSDYGMMILELLKKVVTTPFIVGENL